MNEMTRQQVAGELAKIAVAVEGDHVTGVFIVAVHANGTSSELLVPSVQKEHVEKMMLAVDRLHFRAQVACYLAPAEKRSH
jgi:hypothetical protein